MATILSVITFTRSHKKRIFVLKPESSCQLNLITRNISVDIAPINMALGKCLVSLTLFTPGILLLFVILWLLYGTCQVISTSKNLS